MITRSMVCRSLHVPFAFHILPWPHSFIHSFLPSQEASFTNVGKLDKESIWHGISNLVLMSAARTLWFFAFSNKCLMVVVVSELKWAGGPSLGSWFLFASVSDKFFYHRQRSHLLQGALFRFRVWLLERGVGVGGLLYTQMRQEESYMPLVKQQKRWETWDLRDRGSWETEGQFGKFRPVMSCLCACVYVSAHKLTGCILSAKMFLI